MRAVGMFEAKTHFSEIVAEAAANGSDGICLTNRGHEVAVIISMAEYRGKKNADFWREWNEVRKTLSLTPEEVIAFRDEGRR